MSINVILAIKWRVPLEQFRTCRTSELNNFWWIWYFSALLFCVLIKALFKSGTCMFQALKIFYLYFLFVFIICWIEKIICPLCSGVYTVPCSSIFSCIKFLLKKRKTTGHHLTLPKQIFIVCRIILANFKLILLQLEFTIHHRRYNNFSHSSRCCATSLANYAAMRGLKKSILGFSFPRTFN